MHNLPKDSSRRWNRISLAASLACCALAIWPANAEWTRESCYTRLTNSVARWNPGTPLNNWRVVGADGALGPRLTDRAAVLPLLHPGDQLCVKSTLSSTGSKGPLNPHLIQCHPTGNQ